MKRLVICLDGTWNNVSTNTNVWRLWALCADKDQNGVEQRKYYDVGVSGIRGGGFGKGLSDNVLEGYQWLVENFEQGDEIYIFGFSRGAYTARTLAGFIAKYGVLNAGSPLGIGQLFERYKNNDAPTLYKLDGIAAGGEDSLSLEDKWIRRFCIHSHVKMVGVWDTVGALGIPVGKIEGVSTETLNWMHTGLRTPIENAFHAVAIDEHRKKFAPTLWTIKRTTKHQRSIENVEQRWFPGAHANVGGGYHNDPLSQRPLRWMMKKAENLGLGFKAFPEQLNDMHSAEIADSYKEFVNGVYRWLSPRHFRTIGQYTLEVDNADSFPLFETIDSSIFDRMRLNSEYKPKNIMKWVEFNSFDLERTGSFQAYPQLATNKPLKEWDTA